MLLKKRRNNCTMRRAPLHLNWWSITTPKWSNWTATGWRQSERRYTKGETTSSRLSSRPAPIETRKTEHSGTFSDGHRTNSRLSRQTWLQCGRRKSRNTRTKSSWQSSRRSGQVRSKRSWNLSIRRRRDSHKLRPWREVCRFLREERFRFKGVKSTGRYYAACRRQ